MLSAVDEPTGIRLLEQTATALGSVEIDEPCTASRAIATLTMYSQEPSYAARDGGRIPVGPWEGLHLELPARTGRVVQ